jgi:hypothetical protein
LGGSSSTQGALKTLEYIRKIMTRRKEIDNAEEILLFFTGDELIKA